MCINHISMSFSYKKLVGLAACVAVAVLLLLGGVSKDAAAQWSGPTSGPADPEPCPVGTQLVGWAWSSNIGWISFNSDNAGSGGARHCVSMISGNYLKGWAWSSNIGWIKFGELSGYPSNGTSAQKAQIVGDQLIGWARACAGTVKSGDSAVAPGETGDCSTMTSRPDGWDGWIELTGNKHVTKYDSASGEITGYAWGSDVVGWIAPYQLFARNTVVPPPTASCTLSSESQGNGTYKLTWNSSNVTSCTGTNFTAGSPAGTAVVTPASGGTTYSLMCTTNTSQQISCDSPRDLGGGGGGYDPVTNNPTSACPGCTAEYNKIQLTVSDNRYGTVTNTYPKLKDTDPTVKNARARKGVPFSLTASIGSNFKNAVIMASDDDVTLDPHLFEQTQSITQNAQTEDYRLEATNKINGNLEFTIIRVQVMNPALQEI